ncbi:MAG: hypothetical protein ACON5H_10310 [Akkermansiaceae bacterium]
MIALICLVSEVFAEESAKMPWLGVMLGRPSAEQTQEAKLARGVGLLVRKVTPSGPLGKVGGKNGDLWWKLDDQILVNMGQLVVLLKMRKPGEEVSLQFFREGELFVIKVPLGERPRELFTKNSYEMVTDRSERVDQVEEVAEMTTGGFHYHLKDGQSGLHFKVAQGDDVLFAAPVSQLSSDENMRREWKGALLILRQALAARKVKREGTRKTRIRQGLNSRQPQK